MIALVQWMVRTYFAFVHSFSAINSMHSRRPPKNPPALKTQQQNPTRLTLKSSSNWAKTKKSSHFEWFLCKMPMKNSFACSHKWVHLASNWLHECFLLLLLLLCKILVHLSRFESGAFVVVALADSARNLCDIKLRLSTFPSQLSSLCGNLCAFFHFQEWVLCEVCVRVVLRKLVRRLFFLFEHFPFRLSGFISVDFKGLYFTLRDF